MWSPQKEAQCILVHRDRLRHTSASSSETNGRSGLCLWRALPVSINDLGGRVGVVVRFQVRNPIPLKIRRVSGSLHVKSYVGGQTSSRWCGAALWREGAS
ncbi:hypothetical protein AVEN_237988-1 [Araneus ventricosus]|uniref:Uncharacterized protein n=1 Tax=Araneus ventricosus TaxID=182803 RepID=A0A4Y2TH83_ARAVE|nr:hypothetical protein AVEN_237988-1 [Araneus ventricosus]